ncbi:MAG: hypothetical protein M1840_007596 [Geoglossum simile]|nr:MAG: hypothetical protein M1840_007596 [Geoglossum simile]
MSAPPNKPQCQVFGESFEILSKSPDLSVNPIISYTRKYLIKASTTKLRLNPAPHGERLSHSFQQLGLDGAQVKKLVSLTQAWDEQKGALVSIATQEAPRWEKSHELFWGSHAPSAPSTSIARVRQLVRKIEEPAISALRRRLLLESINEAIEIEEKQLSDKIKQVHSAGTELAALTRKLSKKTAHPDTRLRAESGAGRLRNEIGQYPEGKNPRARVIKKFYKELLDTDQISGEERQREADRFSSYVRWGKKYGRLRPLGILLFLGETSIKTFERESWTDPEYDAMLLYWKDFSGVYHLCEIYTPLLESLKQKFWSPSSTSLMVQEADTPRLTIRHGSDPSEGLYNSFDFRPNAVDLTQDGFSSSQENPIHPENTPDQPGSNHQGVTGISPGGASFLNGFDFRPDAVGLARDGLSSSRRSPIYPENTPDQFDSYHQEDITDPSRDGLDFSQENQPGFLGMFDWQGPATVS